AFYQDPVNPAIRKVVATVQFNYPVDPKSFEEHTTLVPQGDARARPFRLDISYDPFRRTAYLHSENLSLPQKPQYLRLTVEKGVKSATGSDHTRDLLTKNLLIPNAGSYFKVTGSQASIVRNARDKPEQVLNLETTVGVTEADIGKALH